jgi:hypothetical protein
MKRVTRGSVFAKKLSTLLAKAVRLLADCACQSPDIILLDSNTNPVPIGAAPFNPSSEFTADGHGETSAPKIRKPQSDPPSKISRWGLWY